jgi:predicted N-acetyltransferase YhbS
MSLRPLVIGAQNRDWHEAYFRFIDRIFPGVDFRTWEARGGWGDSYHAYVLIEGSEIVANVAVSRLDLVVDGHPRRGAQIGAVGVVPECRGRGLQRAIMANVMPELASTVDEVFLFANSEVLEFYPKFGFRRVAEAAFGAPCAIEPSAERATRLDLARSSDCQLLADLASRARPVTNRFGARGYGKILLWHAITSYHDSCYYFPRLDTLIVARQEGVRVAVEDVFSRQDLALSALLPQIVESPVQRIEFGFTPELLWPSATVIRSPIDDSTLFVRNDDMMPTEPFRFPVLAHA